MVHLEVSPRKDFFEDWHVKSSNMMMRVPATIIEYNSSYSQFYSLGKRLREEDTHSEYNLISLCCLNGVVFTRLKNISASA